MSNHPIVRGCNDIFGPSDVYAVRSPLPGDSQALVYGAVVDGLEREARPVSGAPNDPMMPIAWIKTYQAEGGSRGRVFTTTMGASVDLLSEGLRRLIVNAAYWCVGIEDQIPERADVSPAKPFNPTFFGFTDADYWKERRLLPKELK